MIYRQSDAGFRATVAAMNEHGTEIALKVRRDDRSIPDNVLMDDKKLNNAIKECFANRIAALETEFDKL